ncbi:hypothetical protein GII33_22750 (plasmid) [Gordonia pseudamarae]|uniref:hypothetical protein n=1 Tax=Gordonia pseudamarae TaxID=2831662 RepID=UPI001AF4A6DC|nr:hypothetical protein [Gordonia pseudamarae]QHN28915.1 hypothetical protein GII33_22750 [Gordonia pseudamarae]
MANFQTQCVLASDVKADDWIVDPGGDGLLAVVEDTKIGDPGTLLVFKVSQSGPDRCCYTLHYTLHDSVYEVAVDVPTSEIRFRPEVLTQLPVWLPVDDEGSYVLTGQHPRQGRPGWLRCYVDVPTEFVSPIPAEFEFPESWVAWIITR